jgi:hypothetical protein
MSPEAKARLKAIAFNGLCASLLGSICVGGFVVSNRYVERVERRETPPAVVLAGGPPAWMNPKIAEQVLSAAQPLVPSPATDRQALADRAVALSRSPWVRSVKSLRRTYGSAPGDVIEIDAEFRTPVAMVRWQESFWYVDADGVRLPERFNPSQVQQMTATGGRPLFRIIEGVAHFPEDVGKPWPGKDLRAGLELIALLSDKPYADQITRVDVANYDGRVNANESQINLITRYDTQVRWGQAPSSRAFFVEQRVDRKLDVLQQACRQTGRVDMNLPWIDLRFDSPTAPNQRASIDVGH